MTWRLTAEQAILIAQKVANENGWQWRLPVCALPYRSMLWFGNRRWEIRSNAAFLGNNIVVIVNDTTATVVTAAFLPR